MASKLTLLQWDEIRALLEQGHTVQAILEVYRPFGATAAAIYSRNSREWKIPMPRGPNRGPICPACGERRPQLKGKSHGRGLCAECWKQRTTTLAPEERRARKLATTARWREQNRDRLRAYSRDYAKAHPEVEIRKRDRRREKRQEENRRYRLANLQKWQEKQARYKARKAAAMVEPVDYAAVYIRDGGVCYLCGDPVPRDAPGYDHVIPLSRGGAHSMENVRLTHRRCNEIKQARMLQELNVCLSAP